MAKRDVETAGTTPMELGERVRALEEQNRALGARVAELEAENREFADQCVKAQEQAQAVTSLYVASQRLHATLDDHEVLDIIKEILVELVGAEEFGIFLFDRTKSNLDLVADEGAKERLPKKSIGANEGVVGEVATSGESFFFASNTPAARSSKLPLAAVSLRLQEESVGVVAIYRLFQQKPALTPIDHQVLELLASHAAAAVVTARLHSATDRRLRTVQGFVDLMKS